MVTEKELHILLDKMVDRSEKMYADKDNEAMYMYHTKEMDDLRDDFHRKFCEFDKGFQQLFLEGALKKNWKKLKRETLAVKAILLDELARF